MNYISIRILNIEQTYHMINLQKVISLKIKTSANSTNVRISRHRMFTETIK